MSRGVDRAGRRAMATGCAATLVLSAMATWGVAAAEGGPLASAGQPLSVAQSSLVQSGQEVVWRVGLTTPFSPAGLARDGRTLCLLLQPASGGALTGRLCVLGPRPGRRAPRLAYTPISQGLSGRSRIISAAISRPSSQSLSAAFRPPQIGNAYRSVRWQVRNTLQGTHCSSPPAGGGACATLYPTSPALTRLHTPRLVGCAPAGPSLVYAGPRARRQIALTFDDGPWPQPPSIDFVKLLARYHVPATFFEIGEQLSRFDPTGAVQRKMLAAGDMIGDHTWSHPDMRRLSRAQQRSQLEQTAAAIRRATGFTPCLWRPPYGAVNHSVVRNARSLGFLTIQWDVDPADWSLPGSTAIFQRVVGHAHNGAIVLQHFGGGPRNQTLDALPREIRTLRARGYRFVTVPQLLGLRMIYR